MYWTDLLHKR